MKRDDLKSFGLTDEAIDSIMALHGKDIEAHKARVASLQAETDGAKAQLTEAAKQIEGFKGLDIEGVKKAADEWKAKAEQVQSDAAAQLSAVKFDHALETALAGAKVKNAKAVSALLSKDALKFNDADGSIIGLKEQLEKVKAENDYLFESTTPAPRIVTGGKSQSIMGDPVVDAARKAAGLPPSKG